MKYFRSLTPMICLGLVGLTASLRAADGFGAAATGGAGGTTVTVTNASALKQYAAASGKYIIKVSGKITTGGLVPVTSNKSIIGTGAKPTLVGTLSIKGATNVIVQDLCVTSSNPDYGAGGEDGIEVRGSTHVWVDHCTVYDTSDGAVDVVDGSDYVTVSWCKFYYTHNHNHDFVNLIGNSDTNTKDVGKLHVTLHHNWYSTYCVDRMPRVRNGRVHFYNNYLNTPGNNTAVRAAINSQILAENNHFENVNRALDIYVTTGTKGKIKASGNLYVNCVKPTIGTDTVFTLPSGYKTTIEAAANVKAKVTAGAGCRL